MIMMAAAVVALTASCRDDDPVAEAAPAVRDAEVSVSVRFSLPQSRTDCISTSSMKTGRCSPRVSHMQTSCRR